MINEYRECNELDDNCSPEYVLYKNIYHQIKPVIKNLNLQLKYKDNTMFGIQIRSYKPQIDIISKEL